MTQAAGASTRISSWGVYGFERSPFGLKGATRMGFEWNTANCDLGDKGPRTHLLRTMVCADVRMALRSPPIPREVLEWPYTSGGGGGVPPPSSQTKVTLVGKNEVYHRENLVSHFWYTNFGSQTPPPLPLCARPARP